MVIARALRAMRLEDGLAERAGEEDMEDAMAIAGALRNAGWSLVAQIPPGERPGAGGGHA